MLSELHSLNLKLYSKQYNKKFVLHLIVVPQLSSGWWHNYSTKTRQAGRANEQSMFSLMSKRYPQGYYNMEIIVARKNIFCAQLQFA